MTSKKFLTTVDVSKFLNINEKKVYVLAQKGVIPATKVTGKWLFPYEELVNFLQYDSLKNIKQGIPFNLLDSNILLAAGSDDPILSKIFSKFFDYGKVTLFYSTTGSVNGINMLKNRIIHFALSHLYDFNQKKFNTPYLDKVFPVCDYVVINLFFREIGIVSEIVVKDLNVFKKKNFTFVLRQKGSGVRNITDKFFESGKFKKEYFNFYNEEVSTHFDVGRIIKDNKNVVGIATKSTAQIFNLKFLNLFDERFDVITLKNYFFADSFQKFYNFLTEQVENKFSSIDGYNFSETGKII